MSLTTKIRKQYNPLFVGCFELRDLMLKLSQMAPPATKPKDGIAVFIMAETYRSFSAILALARLGFSEDAEKICRSMYDGYIHLATVLKDDTDAKAMQYLAFDDVTRAKMYRAIKDRGDFQEYFEERQKNPKPGDEPVADVEARAAQWREEYDANGWNNWQPDKTARQQAEAVGMEHYFGTAYELESHLIHVLPRVMNRYLADDGEKIVMQLEPSEKFIDMCLVSGFNMAFNVAEKFNQHFKLLDSSMFGDIASRWRESVAKYKEE